MGAAKRSYRSQPVFAPVPRALKIPLALGAPLLLALLAALMGVIAALYPQLALGLIGVILVTALAFLLPVAHLLLLLAVTALIPPEIQNQVSAFGGLGGASDVFLISGVARAMLILTGRHLDRRQLLFLMLAVALLAGATTQLFQGLANNREASDVLGEYRVIANLAAALLMAMPLVADADQRDSLFKGLVVLGLALGTWGIGQWALDLRFTGADEALKDVANPFLTAGRTVGLFAFPVAAIMALAAWTSGRIRTPVGRLALAATVALNSVSIVLTFERTFWIATLFGMAFVMLRSSGRQRAKLILWTPAVLVALLIGLATVASAEFAAAHERLLSVRKYQQDDALRYRIVESERVLEKIKERPVLGSGFAATISIGRPGTRIPPRPRRYAENGYLWLIWKMGIPTAAVGLTLLTLAIVRREPSRDADPLASSVRQGAQAALLTLALASVTFASFNSVGATAVMGVLIAICAGPSLRGAPQ